MRNIFHNSKINFRITCKVKFQVCKREFNLWKSDSFVQNVILFVVHN